jgi:hypothetical protein
MSEHLLMDAAVAGGLTTAPIWAPSLADVNAILSTATLAIGLILGLARLTAFVMDRRRQRIRTDEGRKPT